MEKNRNSTDSNIRISRQELYNLVWSKPLVHLAKDYQLSDVGLAKICRRHNIPLPPMGYWAKLAHGHSVKHVPLPVLNKGKMDDIEFTMKDPAVLDEIETDGSQENLISEAIGHSFIKLLEFKKEFHPLIVTTQKELREHLKTYKKIEEGQRIYIHNISVTKSSSDRALSLMNMLFQIVEANALPITRKLGYKGGTYINVDGVDVQVDLKEKTKRSENPDQRAYHKYIFHPTGILYFELTNFYIHGARRMWSDTPLTKLEEMINEVASGIVIAAILGKKRDEEWERSRKEAEGERERGRLVEEQKKKEHEKVNALMDDVQKWQSSVILRDYIRAVEEKYASIAMTAEEKSELERWIAWAKDKANICDPVKKQPWNTESS